MHTFSFERLDTWQLSRRFVVEVYTLTKQFPDHEKFGLISQICRASVSVASNIAEGSSRRSPKDQAHFSEMAYSSLIEVLCQLTLAHDLAYIAEKELLNTRYLIEELSNKINALRNSQLNRVNK